MDTNKEDTDTNGGDADTPVRRIKRTFVAPLGELPDEKALREVGEAIERQQQKYYLPPLPQEGIEDYTELLRSVLERVKGTEGIFSSQVGEANEMHARIAARYLIFVPILAAVGVHAERSVYVVYYGLMPVDTSGRPYNITEDLQAGLPENPEARKELEVLQRRLLDLYPTLEAALRISKKQLFFLGVLRRGHLLFPINLGNVISHVLVGTLLLSLKTPQLVEDIEKGKDEFLVQALHREPALKVLPPEIIQELLDGRGDVEEAARVIAMDFFGNF
jgi:hypothetical protein